MNFGVGRAVRSARGRWRDDRGQSLVEFAIALPLLLMLFGIFEFARAYSIKQTTVNAAREGARQLVVNRTEAEVDSIIRAYMAANRITPTNILIDTVQQGTLNNLSMITVTARYDFLVLGPLVGLVSGGAFSDGVNLTSRATMRLE